MTTSSPAVAYVVSQDLLKVSSLLPSNKKRSFVVHSLVKAFGLLDPRYSSKRKAQILNPRPASEKDLSAFHDREYLDFVLDPRNSSEDVLINSSESHDATVSEFGLRDDSPLFRGLPEYIRYVAGASITAAEALKTGKVDVAICWDGGRHHAHKDRASGYCYVADCVLAILALKKPALNAPITIRPRILYLDLDLHFSDGVSHAFYSPTRTSHVPQVMTISLHHAARGFFPESNLSGLPDVDDPTFDPFTLSIPLKEGAGDATMARVWRTVERVKEIFDPTIVVLQCGVDGLAGDPCATFNWSLAGGDGSFGWCVDRVTNHWGSKVLLLGGGGYSTPNAARAYTYLTSIALNNLLSLDSEIPDHSCFSLYSPSWFLDVPAGYRRDLNTEVYLSSVESVYGRVCDTLKDRMN